MIDRQSYTGELHDANDNFKSTFVPLDGEITLDNNWAPYCQATVTIATPSDLSDWDSRIASFDSKPPRVHLGAFQEFCDSEPLSTFTGLYGTCADLTAAFGTVADITALMVHSTWGNAPVKDAVYRAFNLAVVAIEPRNDGTSEVTLRSDDNLLGEMERPLQIAGDVTYVKVPPIGGLVAITDTASLRLYLKGFIQAYFYGSDARYVFEAWGFDYDISALAAVTPVASPPWSTVRDYLQTLVQLAGGRLWCDETRVWRFQAAPTTQPETWTFDASESAMSWSSPIGRETTWYSEVAVVYTWTDDAGAQHTETDFYGPFGTTDPTQSTAGPLWAARTYLVQRNMPYPGPGAAEAIFNRVVLYGNDPTIEAVNDFSVQPGQAAALTLPTGDFTGVVGAVSWKIAPAEMSVTPRQLV